MKNAFSSLSKQQILLITVASLGYFVDIYDLVIFNVVKKDSLMFFGLEGQQLTRTGISLFNYQMIGMLIGGILWGVWGDKKGRISVLFGSILMYSAANFANAFVHDIGNDWLLNYKIIRVIAGIGLAGELGAGITLVSETMSKEHRGYGTMIIVTFGALGAVLAGQMGVHKEAVTSTFNSIFNSSFQNWQIGYIIGGALGFFLLILRIGTYESGMFRNVEKSDVKRGDFLALFKKKDRLMKYLFCILIGLPIWYVIGVLINLSEETFAKELGIKGVINGNSIMYAYIGLSAGDLLSGVMSQIMRSRKKVVVIYLIMCLALSVYYLYFASGLTLNGYYMLCFLLGITTGYWAIFVTIACEQFGTNIRSTVTNTVPNFVRGAVVPITTGFAFFQPHFGFLHSAALVGIICIILALVAVLSVQETFGKDLDYCEQI